MTEQIDDEKAAGEEFWLRLAGGALQVQRCTRCSRHRFPPSPFCPQCGSRDAEWAPISPRGTIWSFTTYRHAFDKRFADDLPYTVALVELEDDVRMIGRLHDGRGEIGDVVELVMDAATTERRWLEWRRVDG